MHDVRRTRHQPAPPSGRLPDLLIVGAMRSGTTSLARYLGAHPQVFIAPQKEVHYFDRQTERGLAWYRQQFALARHELRVGEATQTYLYEDDVAPRLAEAVPDAQLIAILRNPVDRAYSHYWLEVSHGREPLSFAQALQAEPERLSMGDQDARFNYSYVDRGRYVRQLRRLERYFRRDAIHVVLFEDLRDHTEATFAQVCDYLGIDASVRPGIVGQRLNGHTTFRSLRLRRMSLRLPALARRAAGAVNARPGGYPAMDPNLRAELTQVFKGDNRELEAWLGRRLSLWDG